MRKYGKYEKRPEGANGKQPKAKSALLQTYFTSLLCMVLCVTMFFGTSYAWFTSEVENAGNEIYIGTLDVGLFAVNKDPSASDKDLSASENKLFDSNIRWEPGYTALETIKIVNEGDLAFKYALNFTEGALAENNALQTMTLANVAKYFDVWVYDHRANGGAPTPGSYPEIIAAGTKWEYAGSLDQLLAGTSVLNGTMEAVRDNDENTAVNVGTADGVATVDTYTIALHMKEDADNSVKGQKITLNVKLVAYQMASEQDSFGNGYDNTQYVWNAEDLQNAIDNAVNGTVIRFANDIVGNVTVTQKPDIKFVIDGDGHTLSGFITVDGKTARYETAGLTIKNIVFTGVSGKNSGYICLGKNGDDNTRYTNNVTVKDCTFGGINDGEYRETAAVRSFTGGDWNLVVDGCTIDNKMHSMLQVANIEKGLKVTNCRVYSKNGANLNHTNSLEMSGCTFDVEGYAVRFGVTDENGAINTEMKSFTIANSSLKSQCHDSDAVIMFRDSSKYATLTLTNTTVDGTLKVSGIADGKTAINGLS